MNIVNRILAKYNYGLYKKNKIIKNFCLIRRAYANDGNIRYNALKLYTSQHQYLEQLHLAGACVDLICDEDEEYNNYSLPQLATLLYINQKGKLIKDNKFNKILQIMKNMEGEGKEKIVKLLQESGKYAGYIEDILNMKLPPKQ